MELKIDTIIAIDAGANGGIVTYKDGQTKAIKMPKTAKELRPLLEYHKENGNPIIFIEKLSVRPDDVSAGADGNINMGKMFRIQKMMQNFEQLKAVIDTTEILYVQVHPMKWQNGLKLRIKGEEKKDRKKRYKDVAQTFYPNIKATMWNCDALLILHFARKVLINDIKWVKQQLPEYTHQTLFEV